MATLEVTYSDVEMQTLARRMQKVLGRVTFRPLLEVLGAHLVSTTMLRFERGQGPGGARWEKSLRAMREGGQTLIQSGRLRDSISERSNVTSETRLEIGTNLKYAAIHQFGGKTAPHVIRPRRGHALKIPGIGLRSQVNHPGSDIPARPFLGIDANDEVLIRDMTDKWILQMLGKI